MPDHLLDERKNALVDPAALEEEGQLIDGQGAKDGQSQELRGAKPNDAKTAAEAQSEELSAHDPSLDRARELLAELKGGRTVFAWSVASEMETLLSRTDTAARTLLTQIREAAASRQVFWNEGSIKRAQALLDAHRKGTDDVDPLMGISHSAGIDASRYAKVTADPGFVALAQGLDRLSSFYITLRIYGENVDMYAGRIRQMHTLVDAGQLVDHNLYWDTQFWLPEIFKHVLQPNLSDPLVKDSKALGRFLDVQNNFIALQARMTELGKGNPYELTSRAKTKAELMALDETPPEYTPSGSRDAQRAEFDDAMKRADEVISGKYEYEPGDIYGIIQRLRMMRDHGPYGESSARDVDRKVASLKRLFDRSEDSEAVKAMQGESTERLDVDIDPNRPMSVNALGGILRTLANEPGEKGAFKFALSGEISSGWAYARGWAELEFFFTVTDTMTCVLGFDAAAAVGAGINLAGLVKAGVEVGGGYSMKARFQNPEDVATWIIGQMAGINQGVGRRIFPVGSAPKDQPEPVVLDEYRGFGGAGAEVDVGVASGEVKGKAQASHTTYSKGGQEVTSGTAYEKSLTIGATVNLTPTITAKGSYTFTAENVVRDMNTANEGEYHNHAIEVGIGLSRVLSQNTTGVREQIPPDKIQSGVLNFFAAIEKQLPSGLLGGVPLAKLHGAFDVVVAKIYESIEMGRKSKGGLDVNVRFEWHNVKEAGAYHNQYFRVGVTPKLTYGRQGVGEKGTTGASISASKSEVVFESIGSETYSYVFQRYAFAWDRNQWQEFVDAHKDDIEALIRNMATPGRPGYEQQFAQMVNSRTSFPEGGLVDWLPVLEAFFDIKGKSVIRRPGEG